MAVPREKAHGESARPPVLVADLEVAPDDVAGWPSGSAGIFNADGEPAGSILAARYSCSHREGPGVVSEPEARHKRPLKSVPESSVRRRTCGCRAEPESSGDLKVRSEPLNAFHSDDSHRRSRAPYSVNGTGASACRLIDLRRKGCGNKGRSCGLLHRLRSRRAGFFCIDGRAHDATHGGRKEEKRPDRTRTHVSVRQQSRCRDFVQRSRADLRIARKRGGRTRTPTRSIADTHDRRRKYRPPSPPCRSSSYQINSRDPNHRCAGGLPWRRHQHPVARAGGEMPRVPRYRPGTTPGPKD